MHSHAVVDLCNEIRRGEIFRENRAIFQQVEIVDARIDAETIGFTQILIDYGEVIGSLVRRLQVWSVDRREFRRECRIVSFYADVALEVVARLTANRYERRVFR